MIGDISSTVICLVFWISVVLIMVICFYVYASRETKREMEAASARRDYEARQKEIRTIERIKKYPARELTQEEFNEIPEAEDLEEGFLETCPIETWFVCRKNDLVPDVTVIGQVIKGDDAFCEQVGSALLSLREREINRYRVKIVTSSGKKMEVTA